MKMNSFLLLLFFYMCVSASAHKWEKFHGLAGCRQGDTNPAIPELKKYLHHFGYLPNEHHDPSKFTESFDEALHSALRTYQLNYNLEATGVLDPPTIGMLTTPRCGVPDIINGTNRMLSGKLSGGRLNYEFFPDRPRWNKQRLTYHIDYASIPQGRILDGPIIQGVILTAFWRWTQVTGIDFLEVASLPADIMIKFIAIDGQGHILAQASAPTSGIFELDEDEDWEQDETQWGPRSFDLESVCVHEIGHLLGLEHSSDPDAVMFASVGARTIKRVLQKDDIDGIRDLYGLPLSAREGGGGDPKLHVAY